MLLTDTKKNTQHRSETHREIEPTGVVIRIVGAAKATNVVKEGFEHHAGGQSEGLLRK
jgi:hypothetical protein